MSKTGKISIYIENSRPVNINGGVFDDSEAACYTVYAIALMIYQLGKNPRTFIDDMLDAIEVIDSDMEGE